MKMKTKDCMYLVLIFTLFAMKLRTVDAVGSKILYRPVQIGANTNLSFALKEPLSYNRSVDSVLWLFNGRIIDKGDNDYFKFLNLSLEISKMTSSMEGIYQRRLFFSDGTDQNDSCMVYLSDETRTILGKMLLSYDEPSRGTLNLTLTTISQLNKPEIISVMKDGKKMCEFTARRKSVLNTPYKCQLVRHSSTSVTVIMSNVSTGTDFHDVTVKGLFPLEGVWRSYSVAVTVLSSVTEFKADNDDIVQGDNVTLNVKYPPKFNKSVEEQYERKDTMVTLKCKADGDPKPKVRLIGPDGKVIDKNPFELKTFGTYRCEATNSLGNDTHIITVKAKKSGKPPSSDSNDGAIAGSVIAAFIVILTVFIIAVIIKKRRRGSAEGRTDEESLTDMSDRSKPKACTTHCTSLMSK